MFELRINSVVLRAFPRFQYIDCKRLACRVKISADDILNYFSYFPHKIGSDIEPICINCQSLFTVSVFVKHYVPNYMPVDTKCQS